MSNKPPFSDEQRRKSVLVFASQHTFCKTYRCIGDCLDVWEPRFPDLRESLAKNSRYSIPDPASEERKEEIQQSPPPPSQQPPTQTHNKGGKRRGKHDPLRLNYQSEPAVEVQLFMCLFTTDQDWKEKLQEHILKHAVRDLEATILKPAPPTMPHFDPSIFTNQQLILAILSAH